MADGLNSSNSGHSLVELLDELRHDGLLWEAMRTVERGTQYWRTGISPRSEIIRMHTRNVKSVLRQLATAHLSKLRLDTRGPAAVLLNYQSAFGSGDDFRIADDSPIPLGENLASRSLREHLARVLLELWPGLSSNNPNYFQIHKLAQKRFVLGNRTPRRLPIYFTLKSNLPHWAHKPDNEHADLFLADPGGEASVIFRPPVGSPVSIENLETFARRVVRMQVPNDYYPDVNTVFTKYDDFISQLLTWSKPLWLCTCSVSDELTNHSLGTVMIFTTVAPPPSIASTVNAMCFEVMNAMEKLERRALAFVDTSRMVARWLNHESNDWFNALNSVNSQLRQHISGTTQVTSSLPDICSTLSDLNICAPRLIDLLNYFSGNIKGTVFIREFSESMSAFMRMRQVSPNVRIELSGTLTIPKGFQIIAFELVRNATKRFEASAGVGEVQVLLVETVSQIILQVQSRFHALVHEQKLKQCSQHAIDHHGGRVLGFLEAMSVEGDRDNGHWLIIRLAEQMGADPPEWNCQRMPNQLLTVTASVSRIKDK